MKTHQMPAAARPGWLQRWWLDRSVRAKGMTVVAIPLIALMGVTSASVVLQYNERQERAIGLTASAVTTSAQQVLADMVNAETGLRGYAATGDPLFLQPYNLTLTRIAGERARLRTAAVAQRDSGAERAAEATADREMAELARLRSGISADHPATALRSALESGKVTMDVLRRQIGALTLGPAAILAARRADIARLESTIDTVSLIGLALGVLAGLTGVALFASGISGRITRAAANADRLGEGLPLEPTTSGGDELGQLAVSLLRAEKLLLTRTAELTAARDQAVTATQAKNAFLSSTSHELRTPLNAVLGFTQLLQLSDINEEDRDSVERILAAGHHLLALINELIDIARIESGEFSLSVEPVAVQPVVEETCQLMTPLAANRSITLSHHCLWPGLAVNADRQRLRQILVNLTSNAIKYNRGGGTVAIDWQAASADRVSLVVTDTGPGIPAADLERIFDPFERLGAEQTAIEGTGIGLPLARAFAEAMYGRLSATSILGAGTTFTLTLPRAPDMVPVPADEKEPARPASSGGQDTTRTRILYIEDNPTNIEVVARFLKGKPGIGLHSVTSGQAGLDAATRDVPDLILLDLHLPGLHGDEVLRRLRGCPATASIPVAILSAEAAPEVIRRMHACGVLAYLTKPLDLAELGQLIDSFTAGHQLQDKLAAQPAPAQAS